MSALPENVRLAPDGRSLRILDQTRLPGEEIYLDLSGEEELFEAVASLRVRGAPAIGVFAAYAVSVRAALCGAESAARLRDYLRGFCAYLNSSRPTAVNLSHMLSRMLHRAESLAGAPAAEAVAALRREAESIQAEDIAMCRAIAEHGLSLLKPGAGLLTHCNAGPLATSLYGTALGPILLGQERGMGFRVWCDETRPLLQGARLTAWELLRAGVDATLICDSMASALMKSGKIDAVLVGCDRMARSGDAANKIGTCGLAVLARHYGIPFYVLLPSTTVDMSCPGGEDIEIEERPGAEIRELWYERPMAPAGVKCWNPAFDVTDAALITAVITERGVARFPYEESLRRMFE